VASLRGHQVTVYEKRNRLGGHLIEGSTPEFKAVIRPLIDWLSTQASKVGVTIELEKEVTREIVQEMRPDVVIISTGSVPMITKIR
jgi:2-enoate reductase